jgi:Uncharacterized conserved protein
MTLTQKETMLLEDMKKQEKLCIDKYNKHAETASGPKLKTLFKTLSQDESQHLNTITQLLGGTVPSVAGGGVKYDTSGYKNDCPVSGKEQTQYMCADSLAMEKHVSAVYNTGIFEMCQPDVRNVLNHIQKEEQEHGEQLYRYMSDNGIY